MRRPWAERARAALKASGKPSAGTPGGERLTPQELQIALLVTKGLTKAEIGRANPSAAAFLPRFLADWRSAAQAV